MNVFRMILWPFSLLYGGIVGMRRWLYHSGILKRKPGILPTLVVGNITVGGTGKTPFVIWLAEQLASHQPAVLSRGYGRKSKGFLEVKSESSVIQVGDEPLEMRHKLPAAVRNFVCEDRLKGIETIHSQAPNTEMVVLDDGFQHLQLKPDVAVLLCDFNRPFFRDWPMPAGRLREFAYAACYATCIVVTKCPADLSMGAALDWQATLSRYGKPVFFANYTNEPARDTEGIVLPQNSKVVCASALANNIAFLKWVERNYSVVQHFPYPDHHLFTATELQKWEHAVQSAGAEGVICSHKDWVKLASQPVPFKIFYTLIRPEILFGGEDDLIELLLRKINRNV